MADKREWDTDVIEVGRQLWSEAETVLARDGAAPLSAWLAVRTAAERTAMATAWAAWCDGLETLSRFARVMGVQMEASHAAR